MSGTAGVGVRFGLAWQRKRRTGRGDTDRLLDFRGVGNNSGVAIETRFGVMFVPSEGKLLRGCAYPSREETLEAVELRESDSLPGE